MSLRVLLLVAVFCPTLVAQTPTGTIVGTVTDPSRAAVVGAEIEFVNDQTGQRRKAMTDADGSFRVSDLPVGVYTATVAAKGFKAYTQTGITVQVNRNVTLDAPLAIGDVAEKVRVDAAPPQVDTVSGALSSVVGSREASELPLNGRNVLQLMALNPGLNSATTWHGNTGNPNYAVNGGRGDWVNYMLDGATNNDDSLNLSNYFPNPDAVQEFSLLTNNFSAEYGQGAGGIVNAVSKSGTNQLHGTAFEFLRNERLNAANYFSGRKDALKRNQYGGTIGGPVFVPGVYRGRDRTFFFFSYQGTKLRTAPTNRTTFVPTAAERQGDFSQTALPMPRNPATAQPFTYQGRTNVMDPTMFDPTIIKMLNATVPLPNAGGNVLRYTVPSKTDNWEYLGRIDHSISTSNKLNGRFFLASAATPVVRPDSMPGGVNIFTAASGTVNRSANVVLADNHIFSPTLLDNLTLSYNRFRNRTIAPYPDKNFCDFGRIMYCYPGGLRFNTPQFGFPGETNQDAPRQSYRLANNVNWIRNRHSLKFGLDLRRIRFDTWGDSGANGFPLVNGQVTGNSFADMLLGLDAQDNRQAPSVSQRRGFFQSYYVQDDIRINTHLTINAGLRWDPFSPWIDKGDKLKRFDPAAYAAGVRSQKFVNAPPGMLFVGDPGVSRSTIEASYKEFAPRLGFAYKPFDSGRTSVRGGYGIFFDQQVEPQLLQRQGNDPPFNLGLFLFGVPFADPFRGAGDPYASYSFPPKPDTPFVLPLGTITSMAPSFKPAYIQQWNFTIEQQLLRDVLFRVSYVGTKGTRLQSSRNINPSLYVPGNSTTSNVNDRRIYRPQYGPITVNYTDGLSTYHSFQATAEKRFSHGVQFNVNYTLSKSLDMNSATLEGGDCCGSDIPQNPLNLRAERGPSSFDVHHRFVASGIWNIPSPHWNAVVNKVLGGWELTPILTAQTGAPLNVTTGQDRSFSANGFDRPDVSGNPVLSNSRSKQDKIAKWFDPSVFVLNPIGQFGNFGRNAVYGPGLVNIDFGLFKNFPIREHANIQYRWEMFNAFNHVNLGNPTTTMGLNLGRILSTGPARIMQMSLKFLF